MMLLMLMLMLMLMMLMSWNVLHRVYPTINAYIYPTRRNAV
jgi:hypothetical protein